MRAVLFPVDAPARVIEIENSLKALQEAVGGYIECMTVAEDTVIIVNEEGRLRGLPWNRSIRWNIAGPALIVGVEGERFCSLWPYDVEFWLSQSKL